MFHLSGKIYEPQGLKFVETLLKKYSCTSCIYSFCLCVSVLKSTYTLVCKLKFPYRKFADTADTDVWYTNKKQVKKGNRDLNFKSLRNYRNLRERQWIGL